MVQRGDLRWPPLNILGDGDHATEVGSNVSAAIRECDTISVPGSERKLVGNLWVRSVRPKTRSSTPKTAAVLTDTVPAYHSLDVL